MIGSALRETMRQSIATKVEEIVLKEFEDAGYGPTGIYTEDYSNVNRMANTAATNFMTIFDRIEREHP